jgi:DnaJ-like protein
MYFSLSGRLARKPELMQNLYDLLGVRPDDDAENLRKAYRKAAKESHPDHHGGDPEATLRFRLITEAYDILRDAEQRAAYDQLLESERRPFRWKVKRALSDMKRHIVCDVTAGAVLAALLAVGYELYAGMSQAPAGEAAEIAAVQPAVQRSAATPQMPMPIPIPAAIPVTPIPVAPAAIAATADGGVVETTKSGPAQAGQAIEVVTRDSEADIQVEPAGAKGAGDPVKNREAESHDGRDVQSADAPSSAAEKRNAALNTSSSGVATDDDRRENKAPVPSGTNTGDVRHLPDIRVSARPSAAVKRQAPSHPPFEQASLENKTPPACVGSQSCSGDIPPLFGVGN